MRFGVSRFRVSGQGFAVRGFVGSGCRSPGFGFGFSRFGVLRHRIFEVWGFPYGVSRYGVSNSGFRGSGFWSGFRVSSWRFRVSPLGFVVSGFRVFWVSLFWVLSFEVAVRGFRFMFSRLRVS